MLLQTLLCIVVTNSVVGASKLNVPRVLLPLFYDFQTNFTLEVTDAGCYNWSPLRPNIVRLQCLDPDPELGCCSRVVVAAASKEFRRNTETVLAEDVHSGLILRCEVSLDVINSLNIVSSTREIFLDESPEAFEVRAYDDQGNLFSTLEGVELDWTFRTVGAGNKSGESTVIRYMTFAESPYETPKSIDAMERMGLKGHIILLEGKQTGAASVTVRLPYAEYSEVPAAGIQLLVLTNLMVIPQDATILKGDNLKYKLQQFQQGRVSEIKFPSAQYHLSSEDSSVEVDPGTGIATGSSLGKARIVLVDGNVGESDVKPPTATLSVATPHELSLNVLPSRKWSVVVGVEYDIVLELYGADRRRFHIGDNAMLGIRLDESYFDVKIRPKNGSFIHGTPTRVGHTEVIGELLGIRDPLGGINRISSLTVAADLHIYEPIRVIPSNVFIPWDPIAKARYEFPLTATGGDGTYTWSSIRSVVAVVTQRGVVKTLEEGSTTVFAAMTLNPTIRGSSVIHVVHPVALDILDTALEAELGVSIPVHVVLYGEIEGKRVPFTFCDAVPFEVLLSDSNFDRVTANTSSLPEPACGTIFVLGRAPGASQVTVKYGKFSATAVVAAHRPLTPLNPSSGMTLLAVGTSRLIVFTGGPRPWTLKPSEHHHFLSNTGLDEESLQVVEKNDLAIQKDIYAFRVSCKQLSETVLTLQVSNKVVGSNSKPIVATAKVEVICGKPKFLQLTPLVKNITKCPLHSEEVVALSYKDLELEVIVKDAKGRRFDNITSLDVVWKVSRTNLMKIFEPLRATSVEEEGFIFPGPFIQPFSTMGRIGVVEIEGRVIGYDSEILFSQSIIAESPPFPDTTSRGTYQTPDIRSALTVTLVNATIVSPNKTEIFAGDSDERELRVLRGSGHFEVITNLTGVVNVKKDGRSLLLKPLEVGSVTLEVVDVCLDTGSVPVFIQVYRVGAVSLGVVEYIERGKSVVAQAILHDENGEKLTTLPSPAVLQLTPQFGSNIISVLPEQSEEPTGEFTFTVKGVALGDTTLSVSAGDVVSRSAPIHVFPPLRLNPRNVTLLVGSSLQVSASDGPPGAHLEFSVDDITTAKVSIDGVIEGLHIGECSLSARAVVVHRETGQKIIVSEDRVDIRVVPLKGVSIYVPITTIVVGGRMPIWAGGPPGTAAVLRFGISSPLTRFLWSLNQESCAEIRTVFHDLGVRTPENEKVVMRFIATKPGRVVVTLIVRVPGSVAGTTQPVEYSDSVTIEVVPATALRSPRSMALEHLLVSPQAVTELRTSRDIRRHQVTSLRGGPDVIKVSQDGVLTSGDSTGAAVVAFGPIEKPWRHLIVYVKPVEYITVNVVPRWKLQAVDRLSVIPNGLDIDLSVSFHDDEGNEFDAVRSNVMTGFDQKGHVNVARGAENGSLVLNVLDSGATLLRVWDGRSKNQPADFIPIRSADVLFPLNVRVSVGDVLCLRMPITTGDDVAAAWTVDDPGRIRLWPDLGIAVACGQQGVTTLWHQASSRLRSRIEIFQIQKIDLLPHDLMLTTAADAVAEYPLVLSGMGEKNKQRNLVAYNNSCGVASSRDFSPCYPFMCKLRFNNPIASPEIDTLFHVAPSFNLETALRGGLKSGIHRCAVGNNYLCDLGAPRGSESTIIRRTPYSYHCWFQAKASPLLEVPCPKHNRLYYCRVQSIGKPSAVSATLTEAIVLQAISLDGSTESKATLIPFTAALFLHQSQIKVTHSKPTDAFTISGIKDVFDQLKIVTDRHLVSVSLTSQTDASRTYTVTVDSVWWTLEDPPSLSVILWSKLTNQKFQVSIRCGGLRVPAGEESFSFSQWVMTITILLLCGVASYAWLSRSASNKEAIQTSESPFLRGRTLEETLHSHTHSSPTSRGSPEYSPVSRPFDDYPIYGSPWKHDGRVRNRD